VCSLRAASQGITLTRASNVAFLELDWTPARHDQAEDRLHRIGQRDAVTAWYLLAPNTIDETMAQILERKRGVISAVTEGQVRDEERLAEAVVRELRQRPLTRPAETGPRSRSVERSPYVEGDGHRHHRNTRRNPSHRRG
jgi:SNF2 family DNA or RNA helicase